MLNLDNAGSAATGETQAGVVLQHANLWGRDHVGSLQYTTTVEEPSKVSVVGLGYHIPLYRRGDSVDVFASYSDIDSGLVSAGVLNLGVSGKGAVYGGRYNLTLARRGELDARLVFGADVKAFKNSVLFGGQDFGNDITVRPLSLAYVASRPITAGEANAALTLVRNVPGGSRGSADDFAQARTGAKAAYTIVRFSAALTRRVGNDWMARLLMNGQLSRDALVPGEQFAAGGNASVRGFDERAVSLDSGVFTNAELYSPNLCSAGGRWQCRALGFYDAATGTRNAALPGEVDNTTLGSVGIGARVSLGEQASIQLDYGHVVEAGVTTGGRDKLHVRFAFAY
jgi:hemolysin activation/secretion protein